jgi:hypothetical protein
MRPKARLDWRTTVRVALVGGGFDRRDELLECLRQGPESVLPPATATVTPPSRWQLATIGQAVPWLQTYTVSGVWRVLQRYKLKFGSPLGAAQVQQYSPDPDYAVKEAHLLDCLRQAATGLEDRRRVGLSGGSNPPRPANCSDLPPEARVVRLGHR